MQVIRVQQQAIKSPPRNSKQAVAKGYCSMTESNHSSLQTCRVTTPVFDPAQLHRAWGGGVLWVLNVQGEMAARVCSRAGVDVAVHTDISLQSSQHPSAGRCSDNSASSQLSAS